MRKVSSFFMALLLPALLTLPMSQSTSPSEPSPGKPVIIPTRYDEHRFYATPVTESGVTLNLYTDSAGGVYLFDDVVERLHLPIASVAGQSRVSLPIFNPNAAIPSPLVTDRGMLPIKKRDASTAYQAARDGMLGQPWFAERVWTFDYPGKRLLWRAPGDLPSHDKTHEVKLGFKINAYGKHGANYARLPVEIDGETIDFLFDTGAMNILSAETLKAIADGRPAERAASFLIKSRYEKLRNRHPEWRVLENVNSLTSSIAMIEVPEVKIGGFTVGPVWFSIQDNDAFQQVAQNMDKLPEGAIGGSALHYLRVTVDWPNAVAVFEKP